MEKAMELADAAAYYEKRACAKSRKAKWLEGQPGAAGPARDAEASAERDRRLAGWLRELEERRRRDRLDMKGSAI